MQQHQHQQQRQQQQQQFQLPSLHHLYDTSTASFGSYTTNGTNGTNGAHLLQQQQQQQQQQSYHGFGQNSTRASFGAASAGGRHQPLIADSPSASTSTTITYTPTQLRQQQHFDQQHHQQQQNYTTQQLQPQLGSVGITSSVVNSMADRHDHGTYSASSVHHQQQQQHDQYAPQQHYHQEYQHQQHPQQPYLQQHEYSSSGSNDAANVMHVPQYQQQHQPVYQQQQQPPPPMAGYDQYGNNAGYDMAYHQQQPPVQPEVLRSPQTSANGHSSMTSAQHEQQQYVQYYDPQQQPQQPQQTYYGPASSAPMYPPHQQQVADEMVMYAPHPQQQQTQYQTYDYVPPPPPPQQQQQPQQQQVYYVQDQNGNWYEAPAGGVVQYMQPTEQLQYEQQQQPQHVPPHTLEAQHQQYPSDPQAQYAAQYYQQDVSTAPYEYDSAPVQSHGAPPPPLPPPVEPMYDEHQYQQQQQQHVPPLQQSIHSPYHYEYSVPVSVAGQPSFTEQHPHGEIVAPMPLTSPYISTDKHSQYSHSPAMHAPQQQQLQQQPIHATAPLNDSAQSPPSPPQQQQPQQPTQSAQKQTKRKRAVYTRRTSATPAATTSASAGESSAPSSVDQPQPKRQTRQRRSSRQLQLNVQPKQVPVSTKTTSNSQLRARSPSSDAEFAIHARHPPSGGSETSAASITSDDDDNGGGGGGGVNNNNDDYTTEYDGGYVADPHDALQRYIQSHKARQRATATQRHREVTERKRRRMEQHFNERFPLQMAMYQQRLEWIAAGCPAPVPIAPPSPIPSTAEMLGQLPYDAEQVQSYQQQQQQPQQQPQEPQQPQQPQPLSDEMDNIVEEPKPIVFDTVLPLDQMPSNEVWKLIATQQIPELHRTMTTSVANVQTNARRISQVCAKEYRRIYQRVVRAPRHSTNQRARKINRDVSAFWKRNEKEEREARKRAEREAAERLRLQEEKREERRQARKLEFLLQQTELFSHFMSKKKQPAASATTAATTTTTSNSSNLVASTGAIDFAEADDSVIHDRAMMNAQNALEKQRAKLAEFDSESRTLRTEGEAAASEDRMMLMMNENENENNDGNNSGNAHREVNVSAAIDDLNFREPEALKGATLVAQPRMLNCTLKEYQIKGLTWLCELYEKGINGILADSMGLGKSVQSISVLAWLAETYGIWGPFIIVTPSSTLHNWRNEFSKFAPDFKVLPYWGTIAERKTLRTSWNAKQLYSARDTPFNVLVTSYSIAIQDEKYLGRIKWQYMILDEAQSIKSSSSVRWKTLLGFNARNRLLLTGTPIQNSMQELWALLHFIMPTIFDSHDEFSEWFSKDIESHAEKKSTLDEHQLARLKMILNPFMLRRLKSHVQSELGEKIEINLHCDLTPTQRNMYIGLRQQLSLSDLLAKTRSGSVGDGDSEGLMNLVMQFRKVANHPELFERAQVISPISFCRMPITPNLSRESSVSLLAYKPRTIVKLDIPRILARYEVDGDVNVSLCDVSVKQMSSGKRRILWSSNSAHKLVNSFDSSAALSFLRLCGIDAGQLHSIMGSDAWSRWIEWHNQADQDENLELSDTLQSFDDDGSSNDSRLRASRILRFVSQRSPFAHIPAALVSMVRSLSKLATITLDAIEHNPLRKLHPLYMPAAISPPIDAVCSDFRFTRNQQQLLFGSQLLNPSTASVHHHLQPLLIQDVSASTMTEVRSHSSISGLSAPTLSQGLSHIWLPTIESLIRSSGKMMLLDQLLPKLQREGHRVLLFFQMTKMIDLMEEYLTYRNYQYVRLDGASKLEDRRDMVHEFQTNPKIFIFLLSTRAGGLGINLTAADTVIFFDNDWNPTVDQQAMDRAHRLGQTRQVTVYRLITNGTIEEKVIERAKQKDEMQKVVVGGGGGNTTDVNAAANGGDVDSGEIKGKEMAAILLAESGATGDAAIEKELMESDLYKGAISSLADERKMYTGSLTDRLAAVSGFDRFVHQGAVMVTVVPKPIKAGGSRGKGGVAPAAPKTRKPRSKAATATGSSSDAPSPAATTTDIDVAAAIAETPAAAVKKTQSRSRTGTPPAGGSQPRQRKKAAGKSKVSTPLPELETVDNSNIPPILQ